MRRSLALGLFAVLAAVFLIPTAASGKATKIDVCHATGNGSYHLINISEKAVAKHFANHGDGLPGDAVPGMDGYEFDTNCQPVLIPGSIVITKATNPAGGTSFSFTDDIETPNSFTLDDGQSNTFNNVVPGVYAVSETVPVGWDLTAASCDDGSPLGAIDLAPGETVTCTFTNSLLNPAIDIEKTTNGVDADDPNDPDVPILASGEQLTWTYSVTNTGDVAFAGASGASVVVTDDVLGVIAGPDSGDVNNNGALDPGETWAYTAAGVAGSLTSGSPNTMPGCGDGRPTYENVGTVVAGSVSDSDPSHYCNPAVVSTLVMANTQAANGNWGLLTGSGLMPGAPISFCADQFACHEIAPSNWVTPEGTVPDFGSVFPGSFCYTGVYATSTTAGGAEIISNMVDHPPVCPFS